MFLNRVFIDDTFVLRFGSINLETFLLFFYWTLRVIIDLTIFTYKPNITVNIVA